ncbi:RNA polymerase 2 transcriptional [Grosmannia clavigera kw1407]|uniref:RNA polymerase 2 transcriptional n=1 Tax=Grosmannia clavigera (strain kw1407 / UAMH 11150) TaxID=655863 RepID=F0XGR2_GROCL|nr:RNA polymerase 2 transcriptional [Grosmannia clavigera kw1407]EFX03035.1 RNA polymerase 2 transcriptional [Grosmannia clavigera kw1407]
MGKNDRKRSLEESGDGDAKLSKKAASADVASAKAVRKSGDASGEPHRGQDAEGNTYWELSKTRRVGISQFKNNTLINIREYYESAGQMRPGKKGISLTLDQFKMFMKALPHIKAELQKDGIDTGGVEDVPDERDAVVAGPSATKKTKKASEKANIDATSDEDSD